MCSWYPLLLSLGGYGSADQESGPLFRKTTTFWLSFSKKEIRAFCSFWNISVLIVYLAFSMCSLSPWILPIGKGGKPIYRFHVTFAFNRSVVRISITIICFFLLDFSKRSIYSQLFILQWETFAECSTYSFDMLPYK